MIGLSFIGRDYLAFFGNEIGDIQLDVLMEETHEWSVDVTSNPVEEGAPVTDHIIPQPDKLVIKGFITDAPLTVKGNVSTFMAQPRTQPVFDLLDAMMVARLPVVVYTKYKTYEDMVINKLTVPRAGNVGKAFDFTAEFIHVRKVRTQVVDVPAGISGKSKSKTKDAAAKSDPKKIAGKKEPEPANSSVLGRLFK